MATYNLIPGNNIQTQIAACIAGDIINLAAGEYTVANGSIPSTGIVIDKRIRLVGAGKLLTILNGAGLNDNVSLIVVTGSGTSASARLEVSEMTLKGHTQAAIFVGLSNSTVQFIYLKNLLVNPGFTGGITVGSTGGTDSMICKELWVEGCEIDGSSTGWLAQKSITAIADAGNGEINVTSASHGLAIGATIVIGATTDYNGTFTVTGIVSSSVFRVAATFTSSQTGVWSINTTQYGFRAEDVLQSFRVNTLLIKNIRPSMSNRGIGFGAAPDSGGLAEKNKIWDIRDLTIEDCNYKGMYIENLEQAYFKNLTITRCGDYQYATSHAAGIDINMKYDDFKNILIENLNITDSGTIDQNSAGLMLKVRDKMNDPDVSYGLDPATLQGFVILGGKITGSKKGIRLGEENNGVAETNMGPCGIDIKNFQIENCDLDTIHDCRGNRNGFIYNNRFYLD